MADPRFRPSPDCEAAPLGDGVALLDLRSNLYWSLNATGRAVWEALGEGVPLGASEVALRLVERFDVAPEVARADAAALLDALAAGRLIEPA